MAKILKVIAISFIFISLFVGGYFWDILRKIKSSDPLVWESEIQGFRYADFRNVSTNRPVVLVGSSSIALYSGLEDLMQPLPIIKRGFGGASVSDISYFRSEIIDKYNPSKIVIYVGAIDIYYHYEGKPNIVAKSVNELLFEVKKNNPSAEIYYIAIRPSPFDPEMWQDIKQVNSAIEKTSKDVNGITYINANRSIREKDGRLRKDIYKFDRTHLNNQGNKLWWSEIKRQIISY